MNTYRLANPGGDRWHWSRGICHWNMFRALGQELNGSAVELTYEEVKD